MQSSSIFLLVFFRLIFENFDKLTPANRVQTFGGNRFRNCVFLFLFGANLFNPVREFATLVSPFLRNASSYTHFV